jgi:hypothetical protein
VLRTLATIGGQESGHWGGVLVHHGASTGSTRQMAVWIADMSGVTACG